MTVQKSNRAPELTPLIEGDVAILFIFCDVAGCRGRRGHPYDLSLLDENTEDFYLVYETYKHGDSAKIIYPYWGYKDVVIDKGLVEVLPDQVANGAA